LPVGIVLRGERVRPAEIVPVVDMIGEGDDLALARQRLQRLVGGRAGRAALAGEQLDDALGPNALAGMGGMDTGSQRQQDRQTVRYVRSRHDQFQWSADK